MGKNLYYFFIVVLAGCSIPPVSRVEPQGSYLQIFLQGNLFVEFEYSSPAECVEFGNSSMGLDEAGKQALSSGVMKISCSKYGNENILFHKAIVVNNIMGRKINVKFTSLKACKTFKMLDEKKNSGGVWEWEC